MVYCFNRKSDSYCGFQGMNIRCWEVLKSYSNIKKQYTQWNCSVTHITTLSTKQRVKYLWKVLWNIWRCLAAFVFQWAQWFSRVTNQAGVHRTDLRLINILQWNKLSHNKTCCAANNKQISCSRLKRKERKRGFPRILLCLGYWLSPAPDCVN